MIEPSIIYIYQLTALKRYIHDFMKVFIIMNNDNVTNYTKFFEHVELLTYYSYVMKITKVYFNHGLMV